MILLSTRRTNEGLEWDLEFSNKKENDEFEEAVGLEVKVGSSSKRHPRPVRTYQMLLQRHKRPLKS